jgi:hypothetical protein
MDDGKQTEVQFEQVVKKMGQQIHKDPRMLQQMGAEGIISRLWLELVMGAGNVSSFVVCRHHRTGPEDK